MLNHPALKDCVYVETSGVCEGVMLKRRYRKLINSLPMRTEPRLVDYRMRNPNERMPTPPVGSVCEVRELCSMAVEVRSVREVLVVAKLKGRQRVKNKPDLYAQESDGTFRWYFAESFIQHDDGVWRWDS